jgi:hypothetical protein
VGVAESNNVRDRIERKSARVPSQGFDAPPGQGWQLLPKYPGWQTKQLEPVQLGVSQTQLPLPSQLPWLLQWMSRRQYLHVAP